MAAFDFPSSPSVNQTYTANGVTWKWNGTMWMRITGAGYLEKIEEGNSKIEVDDSGSGNITASVDGTERLRITSGGQSKFTVGTNKYVNFYAATHNDEANLGAGLAFSRPSDGADMLSGMFAHSDTGLGIAARDHVTILTGGTSTVTDTEERLRVDSAGRVMIGQTSAYAASGTGNMMLTVTKNGSNRTDVAISNQFSGDNASAAIVLATHGQDYILEATGSGNTTDGTRAFRILKGTDERLRITSDGHKWTNNGSIFHGSSDVTDFTNASRDTYNNVSIRAGQENAGTSPTNSNSAIKIYPAGFRSSTTGNLTGGIAWQHMDPNYSDWGTRFGDGAQIWMGAAIHDTPGQERDRFNLWMNSQISEGSQPNNLAIEAYPNGVVRHPKVPAFMVRNSASNNAFSGNARATWNTTILNNGSHFDMTNNVFTAPIDGIYNFTCMMLSNSNTRLFHNFRVNNTTIEGTRSESHAVNNSFQTNTITMTYSLSANDYVDVYVRSNNAYGGLYTNFNGFLVG